jgi:type I restriction enzyme M protein
MSEKKQLKLIDTASRDVEVIPRGKVKCFITGKLRQDTEEESVRQDVGRSLVEEYGYEKDDLDIISIKMGRKRKEPDICVFVPDSEHIQQNIYLIVETKQESLKPTDPENGLDQLESYVAACINCQFALWVGSQRLAFKVVLEEGFKKIQDIPDIPKKGSTTLPKPTRHDLVPAVTLVKEFKRVHDYISVNDGYKPDKAFEELQKLIFIKVYDEQYSSKLQFYSLPDEDVAALRERLMRVFKKVIQRYKYIFNENEDLGLKDSSLNYVVKEFQRFSFLETRTDIKGQAYEEIVGPNLSGDRGEFFTPRNVCNMTIEMLFSLCDKEKLTSPGAMKILDPAVGTGGFLVAATKILKQLFAERQIRYNEVEDSVKDVINHNFFGIDINPVLVKAAQMNMVMHGDGSSNIFHENSLDTPSNWRGEAGKGIHFGTFDIVMTNPPFGAKRPIDEARLLKQFELTTFVPESVRKSLPPEHAESVRKSLPPEQLFIERCLDFLKPGGILGIVLPDSIVSNPGLLWIREWILSNTRIIASIDLPADTFQPKVGTQTSVLILKKKKPEQLKQKDDYDIFMAIPETMGHDKRGTPIFKLTPEKEIELDSDGRPVIDDQLPLVPQMFKKWARAKGML